jgi:hypothetical protein
LPFLKGLECFLDQKSPLFSWKLFCSLRQLFPGSGVQSDDGFRSFPSNLGEPEQDFRRRRNTTMNRPMYKRVFPQALAWAGLVALSGALALAQGQPSPADPVRTDSQIEMDVVHALDASTVLKNDLITAATIQGEVTLSGTVAVASSRDLAESIVSQVPGVTKVHNNLKVGNQQNAPAAQKSADSQQGDAGTPNSADSPASPDGPLPPPDESDAQAQLRAQIRAEVIAEIRAQRQAQQQTRGQDPSSPDEDQPMPPPPAQEAPKGPVTIPQGTLLQLRTSEPVSSKHAKDGEQVQFTVIRDVIVGGVLAIPRGATAHGVVTEVKKTGDLAGSSELALKLTSLDLGGQDYPLDSGQFKVKGPNKAGHTVGSAIWRRHYGHHDWLRREAAAWVAPSAPACRRGRGHGGFRGYSRAKRLDSRRGAGGIPPELPPDGHPGQRAGGSPAGAGALSRRPGALPSRLWPSRIPMGTAIRRSTITPTTPWAATTTGAKNLSNNSALGEGYGL